QAQATQLCIEKERSFLLVTPTGSGKTYPPLIASRWYDKGSTTVWLLPMLSMREQLVKRCKEQGLSFELYDTPSTPLNAPSNLIVSIESTAKEEFTRYLEQLCATQSIARFVLDEAHLLLTHESFRPIMNTLSWAGQKSVQVVLLTATLPVNLVERLFEATGLVAPIVLRMTTERRNISINVSVLDGSSAVREEVISRFQKARESHPTHRILIFSRSKSEVESLATSLKIPSVHGSLEQDVMQSILQSFRDGTELALSCTTCLGVGFDVPDVSFVIHAGLPWDLLSYAQEAGRAGRSKQFSPA
ncbi:P-loop containing nucleoside triphosphate hydrolase protein, partial [Ephemerocybe angulata]